jgi:hypothetical protein
MSQAHGEVQVLVLRWEELIGLQAPLQRPVVPARQQQASSNKGDISKIRPGLYLNQRAGMQHARCEATYT